VESEGVCWRLCTEDSRVFIVIFHFLGVLCVKRPGELVFPECSRCVYVLYLAFD
jgi:hypothetical protein